MGLRPVQGREKGLWGLQGPELPNSFGLLTSGLDYISRRETSVMWKSPFLFKSLSALNVLSPCGGQLWSSPGTAETLVKGMNTYFMEVGEGGSRFKSCLCHFLAMWLQTSLLASVNQYLLVEWEEYLPQRAVEKLKKTTPWLSATHALLCTVSCLFKSNFMTKSFSCNADPWHSVFGSVWRTCSLFSVHLKTKRAFLTFNSVDMLLLIFHKVVHSWGPSQLWGWRISDPQHIVDPLILKMKKLRPKMFGTQHHKHIVMGLSSSLLISFQGN